MFAPLSGPVEPLKMFWEGVWECRRENENPRRLFPEQGPVVQSPISANPGLTL